MGPTKEWERVPKKRGKPRRVQTGRGGGSREGKKNLVKKTKKEKISEDPRGPPGGVRPLKLTT